MTNSPASASTVLVRVPIQTRGVVTVVVSVSELLSGSGSTPAGETVAEETRTVATGPGVTWTVTSGAVPRARLGRVQLTMPPACAHVHPEPEALSKTTPAGRAWVTD